MSGAAVPTRAAPIFCANSASSRARPCCAACVAPAVASLCIFAACLVYPVLFASLAGWNLVSGAFVACMILLAAPLVATSAMNPLLVAIQKSGDGQSGDSGSGQVFFVSTVGSVAGVLVTAFGLIPYVSNYDAVLIIAAALAALVIRKMLDGLIPMDMLLNCNIPNKEINEIEGLEDAFWREVATPFGEPSDELLFGRKYRKAASAPARSTSGWTGASSPRSTPAPYPGRGTRADTFARLQGVAKRSPQALVKITNAAKNAIF